MDRQPKIVRFATGDGVELTADVTADAAPEALPIVLLHGLSQQRFFWGPVSGRLACDRIARLDQRGHGDSDTPVDADYSVAACADDVIALLDVLGWERAVIAGHSWGGSVALSAGARHPDRVAALALIDGGLWSPRGLGDRAEVRARLTPPPLGIPADDLWAMIRSGALGREWSPELQAALEPTFRTDELGRLHSRLGLERHMKVLDGLLDIDPGDDLAAVSAAGLPTWAVVCEPAGSSAEAQWSDLKTRALSAASELPNVLVHRWAGAIHDVPLQWPALVAGFIDTVAATAAESEGGNA